MVRLKVLGAQGSGKSHIYFNSNMVRLKGVSQRGGSERFFLFQFQYGAIKRNTTLRTAADSKNFNSNMVRLKA